MWLSPVVSGFRWSWHRTHSQSVRDGQVMERLAQSGSLPLSGQMSTLGIIDTKIPLPRAVGQVSTEEVEHDRQIGKHGYYEKSMLPLPVERPGPCFPWDLAGLINPVSWAPCLHFFSWPGWPSRVFSPHTFGPMSHIRPSAEALRLPVHAPSVPTSTFCPLLNSSPSFPYKILL